MPLTMPRNQPWRQRPRSNTPGSRKKSTPKPDRPSRPAVFVEGVLQLKGAFGFVLSEDPKVGDLMVSGPGLKMAMGGDRVRARVTSGPEADRRSGEIAEVLVHARS